MTVADPHIGPPDASINPRHSGIATFARLPRLEDMPRADIAVVLSAATPDSPAQSPVLS